MTVRRRLARSNIFMFLVPLLIAGLLLLFGAGVALYILETTYLPRLGLSREEMHITIEQYEAAFSSFETFLWIYLGAVGMALLLTIVFTNTYLIRSLFRHISQPLDVLVAGWSAYSAAIWTVPSPMRRRTSSRPRATPLTSWRRSSRPRWRTTPQTRSSSRRPGAWDIV